MLWQTLSLLRKNWHCGRPEYKKKKLRCLNLLKIGDLTQILTVQYYKVYHYWVKTMNSSFHHLMYLPWTGWEIHLRSVRARVLPVAVENDLTEIRNDSGLKLKPLSTNMTSFWLSLREECPIIIKKATEVLHPFSGSYLCEADFSAMNTMKSKTRSRIRKFRHCMKGDLRVCLSIIRPRTRYIMKKHQAQVSHWCDYVREGFLIFTYVGI